MSEQPLDPMVPLVTGWLCSTALKCSVSVLKVTGVELAPPDAFVLAFASGLRLRVKVEEVLRLPTTGA